MEKRKRNVIAARVIRFFDQVTDLLFLALVMAAVVYGVYSIRDTQQIYTASDANRYTAYKPAEAKDSPNFAELSAINPDVCGWISIYGTGIDYPVVIGGNNDEYINKSVTGEFALGGSIFLDSANKRDFSDFNTVIYGHHMEKSRMFGDLDKFEDQQFFDTHAYGSLYYGGALHGLHIFAMVDADAYDGTLYNPHVEGADEERRYLAYIRRIARYTRDAGVSPGGHIVMLSTCASGTNARYVLFAGITDTVPADPYKQDGKTSVSRRAAGGGHALRAGWLALILAGSAGILVILLAAVRKRTGRERYRP